ncbi:MAG: hypothetical protein LBD55_02290 [Treponema sp.]|nr:hypothetical protein [Treponema sp.]
MRSANRSNNAPSNRNNNLGFRLALPQPRGMLISRGTAASREKEQDAVFRAFEPALSCRYCRAALIYSAGSKGPAD